MSADIDRLTWPWFAIRLVIFPWSWRFVPHATFEHTPQRSPIHAGWWGVTFNWLFLDVDFGFNLPPFAVDPSAQEGCDCTELCSMGPTCPGGGLAGLSGAGCWRTTPNEEPRP